MLLGQRGVVYAWLVTTGLAGCQPPPPDVPIYIGSEKVAVYEDFDVSGCENRGRISAEDWIASGGSRNFEGAYERAMQLLRNEAGRFGADTVVIDEQLLSPSYGRDGFTTKIYAHGHRCELPVAVRVTGFADELPPCDPQPMPIHRVSPEYPRITSPWPIAGHAVVKFAILETGEVEGVELVETKAQPTHDEIERGFGESAVTAMALWRYKPPQRACRSQVKLIFEFEG